MACIDIYQALVEERPYKKGLEHKVAIEILNKMANEGQLDSQIIKDIDHYIKEEKTLSRDESTLVNSIDKEAWKCPVCGYIHEGPLPQDFICPRCEQPACIFTPFHSTSY